MNHPCVVAEAHPEHSAAIDAVCFPRPWPASDFAPRPDRIHLGLRQGTSQVGYLYAARVLDEVELWRVAVLPAARRKGGGGLLLDELLAICGTSGVKRVMLEVSSLNHAAVALYRRMGFRRDGSRTDYYGPGDDASLMSRTVQVSQAVGSV
jgi:ribosomal-protein-alanine N-acetyltransferase